MPSRHILEVLILHFQVRHVFLSCEEPGFCCSLKSVGFMKQISAQIYIRNYVQ